jgi:DNA-binding winged helix-turn-helix (wHTH) protein
MEDSRNLLFGKRKYLAGWILLSFIAVICVAFSMTGSHGFDIARREIMLRRIGHEVLLQSGDSTSRVLPVKKISANEYQVSFEKDLTFQPDSLVNITQRLLSNDPLARDYVVNVLQCADDSVTYGYAISKNKKDDIVACIGRRQPVACYKINITFKPAGFTTPKYGYLLGGLPLLALVGFIFLRPARPRKKLPDNSNENEISLGAMSFNTDTRQLLLYGNTIELTKTEARVLHIFALSPNETIERSRLQKEIWEDDGVIVGRSLDMFISKLRKKLEADPDIKIVVVRGKGYKLEINA